MGSLEDTLSTVIARRLEELTDAEIVQLNLGINWNDCKSRRNCEGRPWFSKVEDLFTEGGERQEVHSAVRDAIGRVMMMRLEKPSKITPMQLRMAVATHLDGTNLGGLIEQTRLETDETGNIKPHVIRNLRIMLKVAIEKAPDAIVKMKCQALYDFLAEYAGGN